MHLVALTLEMSRVFAVRNLILQKVLNDVAVLVVHDILASAIVVTRISSISELRLILVTFVLLMRINATNVRLHLSSVTIGILLDLNLASNTSTADNLCSLLSIWQVCDLS